MPATKVNVEFLRNPRISNRNTEARITAIVGLGPTTRIVVDEAVTRGTGSVDYLGAYPGSGVAVSQVADFAGVYSGALNYGLKSADGVLYNKASGSVNVNGAITWPVTSLNEDVPAPGSVYYVSYTADVPSTQYDPEEFSDKGDILAKYGVENNSNGILTVAGSINLENGAPSVLLVQASGSSYNEANYKLAIDKLLKRSNIEDVVIVFPSNLTVSRTQQETIISYAFSHVMRSNALGRERGLIYGSPSAYSASGGIDEIGDIATAGTYCYKAFVTSNEDICYVVPSRVRRKDADGAYMELDANFAAVAVAGLQASLSKRSTPMHEMKLSGIEIEDEKWNDYELDRLSNAGCLPIISKDGVVSIYDCITTDTASADTQEKSVIAQKRLVKRSLRDGLRKEFFNGKGTVVMPTTVTSVEAKTESILNQLVQIREIYGYGVADDPTTGERKIVGKIAAAEPRKITVSCSVKYLYGLKFLDVTVSTYV